MTKEYEIRADFDKSSIIVYQAYNADIALSAIKQQKFVSPFSFNRMTWIKPSFLWLMERSNYAKKAGQEYILAIRIKREKWEHALSQAVLTDPNPKVYTSNNQWAQLFAEAKIHVQWDPERSLKGAKLNYWSIQVGISRFLIEEYNNDWILEIKDYTSLVKKIQEFRKTGQFDKAKKLLPLERPYQLPKEINSRLGISS